MAGFITRGLERMNKLLEDLLSFARASRFDSTATEPVSLEKALQAVRENLKSEIEKTGAQITADPLPSVNAQEAHVLMLLQNLIGNALKYHGQQPPRIRITTQQQHDALLINVTDNGIGVPQEYAGKIFQPFERLHGEEYPGSGIGLATCRKIVTGYGCRIWVTSKPGCGATFSFTLPIAQAQSASA